MQSPVWQRMAAGVAVAASLGLGGGCVGPEVAATAGLSVATAGTTAFIGGQLVRAFRLPLADLTDATRRSIAGLQLSAGTEREGDGSYFFLARERNGHEIAIRLEEVSPVITRVKIRVGIWGDQAISDVIMREIEQTVMPLMNR